MSEKEAAKNVGTLLGQIKSILADLPSGSKLKEDLGPAVEHLIANAAGHEVESSDDPFDPTNC